MDENWKQESLRPIRDEKPSPFQLKVKARWVAGLIQTSEAQPCDRLVKLAPDGNIDKDIDKD